jgi:hypothetical protein
LRSPVQTDCATVAAAKAGFSPATAYDADVGMPTAIVRAVQSAKRAK